MKTPWKIKVVDLESLARISPGYKNASGAYSDKKKSIYIDKKLPEINEGTMRSVLEHEIVHAKLDHAGVRTKKEELIADLLSVCATPGQYQSRQEEIFKTFICRKLSWRRAKDRPAIIRRVLRMAEVRATKSLVDALK